MRHECGISAIDPRRSVRLCQGGRSGVPRHLAPARCDGTPDRSPAAALWSGQLSHWPGLSCRRIGGRRALMNRGRPQPEKARTGAVSTHHVCREGQLAIGGLPPRCRPPARVRGRYGRRELKTARARKRRCPPRTVATVLGQIPSRGQGGYPTASGVDQERTSD